MTNVKITAATDLPIYGWMSASVEIDVMKDKVATFVNAHNYVLKVKGERPTIRQLWHCRRHREPSQLPPWDDPHN